MKTLPLWLKAIIGIAVVGGGLSVVAGIGIKIVKNYFVEKEGGILGEGMNKEEIQKNLEKALEGGFKGVGIPLDLDMKTGEMAVKDEKSGETLFAVKPTGDVPRGFPADIPVFQPSTVAGSMLVGPNKSLHLETDKPMAEVADFYKKAMPERGWQEDHAAQVFGPTPMSNWMKTQRHVSIVATPPEEGKTLIIINVSGEVDSGGLGAMPFQGMKKGEMQEAQKMMQQFMNEMNKMQKPQTK